MPWAVRRSVETPRTLLYGEADHTQVLPRLLIKGLRYTWGYNVQPFFCKNFSLYRILLHVQIDHNSLIFGSPAHSAEREASYVWSLKEALAAYLIMEPLRSDGAFAQEPNPLWINKPFLHKQPAKPTLIIIQSQRMGFPDGFHGVKIGLGFSVWWLWLFGETVRAGSLQSWNQSCTLYVSGGNAHMLLIWNYKALMKLKRADLIPKNFLFQGFSRVYLYVALLVRAQAILFSCPPLRMWWTSVLLHSSHSQNHHLLRNPAWLQLEETH